MTIDDATEFFRQFARREYESEASFFQERDSERVQAVLDALNRDFFELPLRGRVTRPPLDEAFFGRAEQALKQRQPRVIFRVERWRHPKHGDLFAAWTSSHLANDTSLAHRYFARGVQDGLRLISQYDVCSECEGTGEIRKRVCPECRGTGWNFFDGVEVGPLPEPDEVNELRGWDPLP